MAVPAEGIYTSSTSSATTVEIGNQANRRPLDIPTELAPDGAIGLSASALRRVVFHAHEDDLIWVSNQSGSYSEPTQTVLENGGVIIDHQHRDLLVDSELRHLTKSQYGILDALAINLGTTLTREQLFDELHGNHNYRDLRGIDVYVNGLRKQLSPYSLLLATKRGVGYLLRSELPSLQSVSPGSRHRFDT